MRVSVDFALVFLLEDRRADGRGSFDVRDDDASVIESVSTCIARSSREGGGGVVISSTLTLVREVGLTARSLDCAVLVVDFSDRV